MPSSTSSLGLRWAYEPSGLPPDRKKEILLAAICREGIPVDEEFLEALSRPGVEDSLGGERGGVAWPTR